MGINEKQSDRDNEAKAFAALEPVWKCSIAKTSTLSAVDGIAISDGKLTAVIEFREVRHSGKSFIVSEAKRIKMLALSDLLNVPAIMVFSRNDQLFWFDISHKPDSIEMFTRNVERNGDYDENVCRYDFSHNFIRKVLTI